MNLHTSPYVNKRRKKIEFHIHNPCASHIILCGTFNHWAKDELQLKPDKHGDWKIAIPLLPQGRYCYKFYIDDVMATEDIENPLREPDGVNGWNSVLAL